MKKLHTNSLPRALIQSAAGIVTNYKSINFVYENNKTDKLVIFFDVQNRQPITFFNRATYLKDTSADTYDCLFLADKLKEIYPELNFACYSSSAKHNYSNTYAEIISYFINVKAYKTIAFFGCSGGASPALYYAGLFKKTALISNPIIYLDEHALFSKGSDILAKNDDSLIKINMEDYLASHTPKKIVLYENINDIVTLESVIKFETFITDNINSCQLISNHFDGVLSGQSKNHHMIYYPSDSNPGDLIKNALC